MAKHIAERLKAPGPKRMLALDGGGTRGIISIAFLQALEETLQTRLRRGDNFVLADYFDMIGGTSVGSMIAAQLALGARVAEVKERFDAAAPIIFAKPRLLDGRLPRLGLWKPMFEAHPLTREIQKVVRHVTLDSEKLKTGLAIVMKRMDTGSVWPISNNPGARYWEDRLIPGTNRVRRGNKNYKLWELIRSSTAAPRYFSHNKIEIFEGLDDGKGSGHFIDGAVSPHNSPALKMFMMAGIKGYNLGGGQLTMDGGGSAWELGDNKLLLISIGTGTFSSKSKTGSGAALDAIASLQGMISDGTDLGLILLQWLGKSRRPWVLDRDVRSLMDDGLNIEGVPVGPLLSFQRYDMRLEDDDLNRDRCAGVDEREMVRLQDMVAPQNMDTLYQLAFDAAKSQVAAADFPSCFDAVWPPEPIIDRFPT